MAKRGLIKSLGYKAQTRATYRGGMYGPYQAPTSSAFGGTLGGSTQGVIKPGSYTPAANQPGLQSQQQQQPNPHPISAPAGSDPRDPTYWTNVGQLNFAYNNAVAALGTRDVAANTKLSNQLSEYNRLEPIDTQHQRENYNDQGLFYSGHLGEAYGNLVADYARRRTASRDEFATEHSDYLTQLNTLKGQLGFDVGNELNAATGRQISADTESANNNGLAKLAEAINGSTKSTVSSNPLFKTIPWTTSGGHKGVLHIYPDGRKVFVRK